MEIEIKLPYSTFVSIDSVFKVLEYNFPECKLEKVSSHSGEFICLEKTLYVQAHIYVFHDKDKDSTIIGIEGSTSKLANFLLGEFFHYLFRGTFLNDVRNALEEEFN